MHRPDSDLSYQEKEIARSRTEKILKRELHERGLEYEPSEYIIYRMNDAINFHSDYRAFENKLLVEGGTSQQPRGWLRAMRCIIRALDDAEGERRQAEQKKQSSGLVDSHGEPVIM